MNHHCPHCAKRIPDPATQARSHIKAAHPERKTWSSTTRYLRNVGARPFKHTKQ